MDVNDKRLVGVGISSLPLKRPWNQLLKANAALDTARFS